MPPQYDEQHLRQLIRQAEQQKATAEFDYADAKRRRDKLIADADEQLARYDAKFPGEDICPTCWYGHGWKHPMVNEPERPAQPMQDRFVCKHCGFAEIRKA